ncbi:gliding motility-associated C-terminal domain-containing protein [Lewinella sp. LCG006]|uniref:T9SS type B sorting domain-containing protein n=1 Tax=Lewinella sp. LCG006 TaxID=3231911 RepID=UPI00345FCECE
MTEENNIVAFLSGPSTPNIIQLHYDASGNFLEGRKSEFLEGGWNTSALRGNYFANSEYLLYNLFRGGAAANSKTALFIYNLQNGDYKIKQLSNQYLRKESFTLSSNGEKVLTSQHLSPIGDNGRKFLGLTLLDLGTTDSEWDYYYELSPALFSSMQSIWPQSVLTNSNQQFISLQGISTVGSPINYTTLLEIDTLGQLQRNLRIADSTLYAYDIIEDDFGNYYLYGTTESPTVAFENDAFIAKLDANWNVLWARRLHAEEFSFYRMQLSIANNGDAVFSYATFGNFPIIAGRLSANGELLDYQGYSAYDPQLGVTSNQETVFLSERIYEASDWRRGILLSKTNANGIFEECDTYVACLEVSPLEFPTDTLNWVRSLSNPLVNLDEEVTVTPFTATTVDFCGTPDFPSPEFSVPSLLCPEQPLVADSLNNTLANTVFWQITGTDLDTFLMDRTLMYTFLDTGVYDITQYLYVLGCEYTSRRSVRVSSRDQFRFLPADTFVCETTLLLEPSIADFPDSTVFNWQDDPGSGINRNINQSGSYILEAMTDGCLFRDSIWIDFANELSPPFEILIPVSDTICEADLPYTLEVSSNYSDLFWIDNDSFSSNQAYLIEQEGSYEVSTSFENCIFRERFELVVSDCLVDIFIPNVFSPNNDGTNDELRAFGQHFIPRRLSIYDRWGGLVHDTQQAPFTWDGNGLNRRSSGKGVYVVVFEYFNLLSGSIGVTTQDVLLIK